MVGGCIQNFGREFWKIKTGQTKKEIGGWQVDGVGSGSWLVASFGVVVVEPVHFAAWELVV